MSFPGQKNDVRLLNESFGSAQREYVASLDPMDQHNRFLRRRHGLGGSGNLHIDTYALWWVRETIRHMVRSDPLIRQMLDRLTDFLYGGDYGSDLAFHLEPNTGEIELDKELDERIKLWSNDKFACDYYGERTLGGMVRQAGYQTFQDGEIFALLTGVGRLQLIEADCCQSPESVNVEEGEVNGLKFGKDGQVKGYWFTKGVPSGPWTNYRESLQYYERTFRPGLQQVLHCYSTTRVSQNRGYGLMVPVIIRAGMLDDLNFATIVKAQTAANIVGVTKSGPRSPMGSPILGTKTAGTDPDGDSETTFKSKPGSWHHLPEGKDFVAFAPQIPNEQHIEHCKSIIKEIAAAIHLPYILAMLDANETNLSAWRGSVDAARYTWRRLRGEHEVQMVRPVYVWKLMQWLPSMGEAAMRLYRKGLYTRARVVWRGWGYIDPKKDVEADNKTVDGLLDSRRGVCEKLGRDEDRVREQTLKDNEQWILEALDRAEQIKTKYPNSDVTWRDIVRLGPGAGNSAPGELTANVKL